MNTEKDKKDYQYLTIYHKDYIKKPIQKQIKYSMKQEFQDPIAESFKDYLDVDKEEYPPLIEDGDLYLDKVKDDRKKIGKMYFDNPIDHAVLFDTRLLNGKTGYQIDYCDMMADLRRKQLELEEKMKSRMPEDLVIPLTTQKYDYRNPIVLSEHALERPPMIRPVNNLGQDENINRILNVTTGDSEYMGIIGKLGDFIVENQMHGKIVHEH